MTNKAKALLRVLVFLTVAGILLIGVVKWNNSTGQTMRDPDVAASTPSLVQVHIPIDLTGTWATGPKCKTPFSAKVENGAIMIDMALNGNTVSYYYGTLKNPETNGGIKSEAIDDGRFVWSISKAKDFIYQNGSLVFDYEIAGVRTTIELTRTK